MNVHPVLAYPPRRCTITCSASQRTGPTLISMRGVIRHENDYLDVVSRSATIPLWSVLIAKD